MAAKRSKNVIDATTQRLNLTVDADAAKRLGVWCIYERESPGQVVTRLINDHLKKFRVQANPSSKANITDRLDVAAETIVSEPSVAA